MATVKVSPSPTVEDPPDETTSPRSGASGQDTKDASCDPSADMSNILPGGSTSLATSERRLSDHSKATFQSTHSSCSTGEDPLALRHIAMIFLSVAIPNAATLVVFSAVGYGLDVYSWVAKGQLSLVGDFMLCGSCLLAACFLVLDWWYWPKWSKVVTSVVPIVIFYGGAVLKGRKYPWAAMLLTLFMMPAALGGIRKGYCSSVRRKRFYMAVQGSALFAAAVVTLIWIFYVVIDDHIWNQHTKDALVNQTQDVYDNVYKKRALVYAQDCGPNKNEAYLDSLPKADKDAIGKGCAQAETLWFLSWMCPMVAIGTDILVSIFCFITGVIGELENVRAMQRNLTRFVLMLSFILSGLYACVTMSATSVRLGSTLMAFFLSALVVLVIWIVTEVDMNVLTEAAKGSPLMHQLVTIVQMDWTKAMGVGALSFPMSIFFMLNYLCHKCRKVRNAPGTDMADKFTPTARRMIDACSKWNWTSIYIKINLLAELFFMLQVGVAKMTYIFLSWLNHSLRNTSMGIVCVLVYLVGGCMFLLPPVPGLPVYVFAGILLGEKGAKDDRIGFWWGCLIAMALGLFTKLCACVGQYMLGYYMGKSIKVQQLIGVDKVPTRAIEQILKSRGLSPGKVAILVGGPDWPTSVTCGIVRVSIPQMLLGTLPVIALLAPCILAGACMGRTNPGEDSDWSMLANSFTAAAAVVNMSSMAYAVFCVSDTVRKHGDELAKPRPEHAVVAELTAREAASVDCYNRVTEWSNLSTFWKGVLLISALCAVLSNSIFVCFAEVCFRSFAVSSKIHHGYEKNGLRGNPLNMILIPPYYVGVFALGMFCLGVFLHVTFATVQGRKSRRQYKAETEGRRPE